MGEIRLFSLLEAYPELEQEDTVQALRYVA